MSKWLVLARSGSYPRAVSAVSADSLPVPAVRSPIGTNGTIGTGVETGNEATKAAPLPRPTVARVEPSRRPSPALPAYVRALADRTRAACGEAAARRQVRAELAWLVTPRRGLELAGEGGPGPAMGGER